MLNAVEHLERHEGFEVTWLNVSENGIVDLDHLADSIRDDTALVSIMTANNETGVIQPMREISKICRERGVLLHSDMVQSFGKIETDIALVDAASFAAHKFYGPKGAGFLYLRAGIPIEAIQFGGSHENERRPGTENVAAIAGMAAAAEFLPNEQEEKEGAEIARRFVGTDCAKFPRRSSEWRHSSSAREHVECQFPRTQLGNAAHGAGFGRRLRIERLGLHGRFGHSVARVARDGPLDRTRQLGRPLFVRQTNYQRGDRIGRRRHRSRARSPNEA